MVSQSYSTSSSSTTDPFPCPQELNKFKPPSPLPPPPSQAPHFKSSLHVRKLPMKKMKMPIAPLPPTPRRVYKVDSLDFKQLVQKLTAAPEFQARHVESLAPPALSLLTTTASAEPSRTLELLPSPIAVTPVSETYRELTGEKLEIQAWKQSDSLATASPMGSNLSPMSYAWCTSEILDAQPWKQSESFSIASPMGSSLSPWSHMWCSFPLLSPGTVSSFEKGM